MKKPCFVSLLLLAAFATFLPASSADAAADLPLAWRTDGIDLRLPAWVEPKPGTGMPIQTETVVYASWNLVEPERGKYDFSLVDRALERSSATGRPVVVRMENLVWSGEVWHRPSTIIQPTAPAWVVEELGVKPFYLGGRMKFWVIPAWEPTVEKAYLDMVRELIRRYGADPRITGMHVHAIGTWGEEFSINDGDPDYLDNFRKAGVTVDTIRRWLTKRIRVTAEALGPHVGKLAWVSATRRPMSGEFGPLTAEMLDLVIDVGGGYRGGGIERYFHHYGNPAWGHRIDDDGHLVIDETHPLIADDRYWGDENEEYGPFWYGRFPPTTEAQRLRYSMFMVLTSRMKDVWINQDAVDMNPALIHYAELGLGKRVENAGDAFALLSETDLGAGWGLPPRRVRNFERWLRQQDLPGAQSVPALPFVPGFDFGRQSGASGIVYTGRRTDRANGSPALAFMLDERFRSTGGFEVVVEVLPLEPSRWRLEVGGGESLRVSDWMMSPGGADGPVTLAFTVPEGFGPPDADGVTFRLAVAEDSPGDLTVRLVRVLRLAAP